MEPIRIVGRPMSSLFISHCSEDNEAAAKIVARLTERGYVSVFLDFDPNHGIPGGRNWERELYRSLKICRAVIVLCSERSMASRWCFAEIVQARALGKEIIPVKVGSCEIDEALTDLQFIDLTVAGESGYGRLWRGLEIAGLDPNDQFGFDPRRPPYPGLSFFDEMDAGVYFGRDSEIDETLAALTRMLRRREPPRLAIVVGASGSGKSSLVRAGVIPRLRKNAEKWLVVGPVRPGEQPIDELARALAITFADCKVSVDWKVIRGRLWSNGDTPPSKTDASTSFVELASDLTMAAGKREAAVLLVIDQFEELISRATTPESLAFLRLLRGVLELEGSPVLAIATLRSDFLDAFQNNSELREVEFASIPLGPMHRADFPQIIEGPAARLGIEFDAGLVSQMVLETETDDALPLLAFTLRQMYDRCAKGGRFSFEVYNNELGGIKGAVASVANRLAEEEKLTPELEGELRLAFLQLVQPNDAGQWVRQTVRSDSLPEKARPLLEKFVDSRLLTARGEGEQRVLEVVHESIFRVWPKLDTWLVESRSLLLWQRRVRDEIEDWKRSRRLLRGARLVEGKQWLDLRPAELTSLEKRCIKASWRRRTGERLALTIVTAFVISSLTGLTLYALKNARTANERTRLATISVETNVNLYLELCRMASRVVAAPNVDAAYDELRKFTDETGDGVGGSGPEKYAPRIRSVAIADALNDLSASLGSVVSVPETGLVDEDLGAASLNLVIAAIETWRQNLKQSKAEDAENIHQLQKQLMRNLTLRDLCRRATKVTADIAAANSLDDARRFFSDLERLYWAELYWIELDEKEWRESLEGKKESALERAMVNFREKLKRHYGLSLLKHRSHVDDESLLPETLAECAADVKAACESLLERANRIQTERPVGRTRR